MKKINVHLLSMRSLLAFHIAAQEQSFTRAAAVLRLGQSAVSHSVRQLETVLGVKLFEREAQGVRLTAIGQRLAKRMQLGFGEIQAGLEEAISSQQASVLTILVSTSLASHWLMPRIARFKQAYPEVQLRIITQDAYQDIAKLEFDLCIPVGGVPEGAYQSWKFVDEVLFPVCSPAWLAQQEQIQQPSDLLTKPLIHLEEHYIPRFNWPQYFQHYGLKLSHTRKDVSFNDYSIVVQAAIEGQGVVLGWHHIVQPLIEQGKLVAPLRERILTPEPFYVIAREDKSLSMEAQALLEWLLVEMQQTVAEE
ncbi:LysR substrate-binding domain-containing protein [uncultured Thiothrix sp.]|uniref:LysR substrate-binding domain-containing protein n=1 Tax=uncultured Thiothrix sp. TaxID=223185 RepID=UPI00261444DC|nr:LysR substrate-binding domain-containing protein [uncultured Thiothrix sp.]